MTATVPTTEPTSITAGDSLAWTRTLADYPADGGWVLSYVFLASGKTPIAITSSPSGATHAISVPAATSANYVAATYHWSLFATKSATSERKTISSGVVTVLPNPATLDGTFDPRTHAEKCLAAIEAVLEGRVSDSIVEYKIGNREAKKIPHSELVKLRVSYQNEVRRQRGIPRAYAIPVRFTRV